MKKLLLLALFWMQSLPSLHAALSVTATQNTVTTATAGDTLTYTAVIGASGGDATGVTFTDPISDPNLQLVPGSLRTTPIARPDSYAALGNVSISVAAPGVLSNDSDPDGVGPALSVTAFTGSSAQGGNITMSADGSFTYNPPAGFEGTDTFTYLLNDNDSPNQTDVGTVSITVSGMIWFINSAAAPGGDGRLSAPFQTLGAFQAINNGTGTHPAANDSVFLYAGSYAGPLTLLTNQKLVGAGAGASLQSITGLTSPPGSASLPDTGGSRPSIALGVAGNNITLAQGNLLRGLNIATTAGAGTALIGNNFGPLTVLEVSVSNVGGTAINLNNGNPTASFTAVSASGGANGIVLTSTTGSFTVTGTGAANSGGTISSTSGSDGTTAGIGVYLNNVTGVSLSSMHLNNHPNWAIRGITVTGFQLLNSTVDGVNGTSTALQEGSISFSNLLGTGTLSNCTIKGGVNDNVTIINTSGSLDFLSVTGCTIRDTGLSGNDGIHLEAQGTAAMTVKITGANTFAANRGDHLDFQTISTSATGTLVFTGNTLSGGHASPLGQGITIGGIGSMNYNISNNTLNGAIGTAINAVVLTAVPATASGQVMSGTIANNTIGTTGVLNSGSAQGNDIVVEVNGPGTHSATVSGNTLRQYGNGAGLQLTKRNGTGVLNVMVTGNTIAEPGQFGLNGILLTSGATGGDTGTSCVDIGGAGALANNLAGSAGTGATDFRVRQRFSTTVRLPGYGGASTDTAAVVAFIQARNNGTETGSATADTSSGGGGFIGGAACGGGANPTLLAGSGNPEFSPLDGLRDSADISLSIAPNGRAPARPAYLTAAQPEPSRQQSLTDKQLQRAIGAAVTRWMASGLDPAQVAALQAVRFKVAQLPAGYLADSSPGLIRLDSTAAGAGWFLDATPDDDSEFAQASSPTRACASPNSPAVGHMDLLTTVLHEMGHVLGLVDTSGLPNREQLMFGVLNQGERRLPAKGEARGAVPGTVVGTHFLGGPLNVSIGTLPAGHSVTLTYQTTVANPFPVGLTCQVSAQGTVSGSNFSDVLTDDPDLAGVANPTLTIISAPPIITCPSDVAADAAVGQCNASVSFAATAAGCPSPTLTYRIGSAVISSPHSFPVGVTTVTVSAANGVAPAATCTFTVVVVDTQPPTITCPANLTVPRDTGKDTAIVSFTPIGADNCGTATIVCVPASGSTFSLGLTTVNCVATDGANLTAPCSFTVTVINAPPVANPDTIARAADQDVKVSVATLLSNDSDPENDSLSITAVNSPSANGATVSLSDGWIRYTHNGATADSFTYTLSDSKGATATGTVTVSIEDSNAQSRDTLSITVDGTGAHIRSDGIPGRTYVIQSRDDINQPWQDMSTISADAQGVYHFDDPAGSAARYYRSVYRAP